VMPVASPEADLEGEIRAPPVEPPAAASSDSVVEFPVLFDQSQRPKAVHEEAHAKRIIGTQIYGTLDKT
jgi:hypothetical protein